MITPLFQKHYVTISIAFAFTIGFMLGLDQSKVSVGDFSAQMRLETKNRITAHQSMAYIVSISNLLGHVSKQRRKTEKRLRQEFGYLYGQLFDDDLIDRSFVMNEPSRDRLLRRLMIKILMAQLGGEYQDSEGTVKFTWVTAGDSAAAAHGNLFSQSYTAVMEDTVNDVFRSVGINFVAKNRGTGRRHGSAPELAFCMESIYGKDIDILSSDFFISDRAASHRIPIWGIRAGIHPTKPILLLMDKVESDRWRRLLDFETAGMGTVLMDRHIMAVLEKRIANQQLESSDAIPLSLKKFVCNSVMEGSAPCKDRSNKFMCNTDGGESCTKNKYSINSNCDASKLRAIWNPGWKHHLLKGRILGHFLIEQLHKALVKLDSLLNPISNERPLIEDPFSVLQHLQSQEMKEIAVFNNAPHTLFGDWNQMRNKETLYDINPSVLFRSKSICHTALLPSESRYKGMLQPVSQNDVQANGKIEEEKNDETKYWFDKYSIGANYADIPAPNGKLQLTYDPQERQECNLYERDYNDFFHVPFSHGWVSVTIPHSAETRVHNIKENDLFDKKRTSDNKKRTSNIEHPQSTTGITSLNNRNRKREGFLMICLRKCTVEVCPVGFAEANWKDELDSENVNILVNDKPVTGMKEFEGCFFLEGANGLRWGRRDINAQNDVEQVYELKFRLNTKLRELQISSIIAF